MALKHSYHLLAPVYDLIVDAPLRSSRIKSIDRMDIESDDRVLIDGIGTGLDLEHLPPAHYTGSDITLAMLQRAHLRAEHLDLDVSLVCCDSQRLPFADHSFDHVIMHLIMAVVPDPQSALREACRVLRPGGKIYLFDKFLRPGQLAPARRFINLLLRHIATRTNVIFEDCLTEIPDLRQLSDRPVLAGGWFRLIELERI